MNAFEFGVITEVCAAATAGNLANGILYESVEEPSSDHPRGRWSTSALAMLHFRSEVFTLGEILVLNRDGREPFGRGRKPSKWDVICETFETIEAAIERAEKVMEDNP